MTPKVGNNVVFKDPLGTIRTGTLVSFNKTGKKACCIEYADKGKTKRLTYNWDRTNSVEETMGQASLKS